MFGAVGPALLPPGVAVRRATSCTARISIIRLGHFAALYNHYQLADARHRFIGSGQGDDRRAGAAALHAGIRIACAPDGLRRPEAMSDFDHEEK